MSLNRRDFMKVSLASTALAMQQAKAEVERRNGMPYRVLGKTGEKVSLLCLGGYHIGQKKLTVAESVKIIRTAIDEGVNFLDNAWEYNEGVSEERMGLALQDGYRDKVFLMTKHHGREAKKAQAHLEDSLRRFKTDVIDLWQFHEVVRPETPGILYESDALDFALKAKEGGKIRYIGCTGHNQPAIQAEMIDRGFPWDAIQFPVNIFDWNYRSFQKEVIPKAAAKNIAVIGMKSLGGTPGALPKTGAVSVEECLRYSMSQPIASLCSGIDDMDKLHQNIGVAKAFTPMSDEETATVREKAKAAAANGKHERYKKA